MHLTEEEKANYLTATQRAQLLLDVHQRMADIVADSPHGPKDVRQAVFNNLSGQLRSGVWILNIVATLEEGRMDPSAFAQLVGLAKGDLVQEVDLWLKRTRLSMVTMFQFQLESGLKNILNALRDKPPPNGFATMVNQLMAELDMDADGSMARRLKVLAAIRNSLHSNGTHTTPDLDVTIDETRFRFVQNEAVTGCASWGHIAVAMNSSVEILDEIVRHERVAAVEGMMPDRYEPDA